MILNLFTKILVKRQVFEFRIQDLRFEGLISPHQLNVAYWPGAVSPVTRLPAAVPPGAISSSNSAPSEVSSLWRVRSSNPEPEPTPSLAMSARPGAMAVCAEGFMLLDFVVLEDVHAGLAALGGAGKPSHAPGGATGRRHAANNDVSGSTSSDWRIPASSNCAYSRFVTASITPTFHPSTTFPVIFAAPRICVPSGTSA